jgi:urea transport system ATP-binding protein
MLSLKEVSAGYGEGRIIFDVNMDVPAGQVVCLLGRNGVGKSTLLKTVMGILKAKSGQITLNGLPITHFSPSRRAQAGISYVPQGRGIFPHLTVYENLLMGFESVQGKKIADDAIQEAYELFPVIKTMHMRMAGTLSGGQQQQLAIARALVSRPKLLVLDEPTEGIQPSIVQEIEKLIVMLREQGKMSILLVEQFLDFALGIADYCYVMEKGNIVSSGPANDLQQNVIKEYLSV